MANWNSFMPRVSRRTRLTSAAVSFVALGAAGGASAAYLTHPAVEMAPVVPTAIARLPRTDGIVTVKGRISEVYGDHFIVQDNSGRTLVDAGPAVAKTLRTGDILTVQGRFDDGQVRASYLVDPRGQVEAVGRPPAHGGPKGPGRHDRPAEPNGKAAPLPPPPPPTAKPGFNSAPPPPRAGADIPPLGNNPPPHSVDGGDMARRPDPAAPFLVSPTSR